MAAIQFGWTSRRLGHDGRFVTCLAVMRDWRESSTLLGYARLRIWITQRPLRGKRKAELICG